MDRLSESLRGSDLQGFREPVGRMIRVCDPPDLNPSVSLLASIKRARVLAVRAASVACEYPVGVAALVVEKLHYDRIGHCDPLWLLLQCSSIQRIWLGVGEK